MTHLKQRRGNSRVIISLSASNFGTVNKQLINRYPAVSKQHGFTLIELMLTIMLGLLISAAALQIFLTSSQSSKNQQASSQIQDNIVFGMNQLTKHIRRANHGAQGSNNHSPFYISHDNQQGGIVLTAPSAGSAKGVETNLDRLQFKGGDIPSSLLSRSSVTESNIAGGIKNDQLTIQYQMPIAGQFDCQGRGIPQDFYVIERYFVRDDNGRKSLACASTNYELTTAGTIDIQDYTKTDGTTSSSGFDGKGSVIIPNVDLFRVLYGVTSVDNFVADPDALTMKYIAATNTPAITFAGLRILSVELGLIIGSESPISAGKSNEDYTFNILDKRGIKLNTAALADRSFLRDEYETSVLLRNGRGK